MLKKYFATITLFMVLTALSLTALIIVVISRQPEEMKLTLLYNLMLATLFFVGADVTLKLIFKKKAWLWISQIIILLVLVYIWIVQ